MPFKSEAQRRMFHAMADRGEISEGKVHEWEHKTKSKKELPMHTKKSEVDAAYEFGVKLAMEDAGVSLWDRLGGQESRPFPSWKRALLALGVGGVTGGVTGAMNPNRVAADKGSRLRSALRGAGFGAGIGAGSVVGATLGGNVARQLGVTGPLGNVGDYLGSMAGANLAGRHLGETLGYLEPPKATKPVSPKAKPKAKK